MKRGIAVIVLTLIATSATAWFDGDRDRWDGWNSLDGYGYHDGRGRGYGRGRTDMDGSFSMTINASGSANTEMDTDFDGDWNSDYYGDSGWGSHSYPRYYGYYGAPAQYNPTAGFEAHRKRVEERRAAVAQARAVADSATAPATTAVSSSVEQ